MPLFVGASESYDTDAWEAWNRGGRVIVEMTPKYAEYERHKGERFETDGKTYEVGGEEVYYLKGYGAYAKDGLRELGVDE